MGGHLQGGMMTSWLGYVDPEHQAHARVLASDVRLALPQLDVGVPQLQDPGAVDAARNTRGGGGGMAGQININATIKTRRTLCGSKPPTFHRAQVDVSHGFHVVLGLQGDLQDFGAVEDLLVAGGGDRLPRDAVHLVEGVRLQDALVCRADEDLQPQRLLASVAMQLEHTHTPQEVKCTVVLNTIYLADVFIQSNVQGGFELGTS